MSKIEAFKQMAGYYLNLHSHRRVLISESREHSPKSSTQSTGQTRQESHQYLVQYFIVRFYEILTPSGDTASESQ